MPRRSIYKPLLLSIGLATLIIIPSFSALETFWNRHNPLAGAWQQETIYYYNHSEYQRSLQTAFQRWEQTGLGIKFRPSARAEQADLQIYSSVSGLRKRCDKPDCLGWATIGQTPFRQAEVWLLPPSNPAEDEINDFIMLPTIIHELGHVLGLRHSEQFCSTMNSAGWCQSSAMIDIDRQQRRMPCGPWADDVAELQELYPQARKVPSPYCHDQAGWQFIAQRGTEISSALRRWQRWRSG